jgi:hypothetical protein
VIRFTKGDTSPDIVLELIEDEGVVDLTGVLAVTLKMLKPSGAEVSRVMVVSAPATAGVVKYTPVAADFDEAGVFYGDVKITHANATVQHAAERLPIYVRDEYGKVPS